MSGPYFSLRLEAPSFAKVIPRRIAVIRPHAGIFSGSPEKSAKHSCTHKAWMEIIFDFNHNLNLPQADLVTHNQGLLGSRNMNMFFKKTAREPRVGNNSQTLNPPGASHVSSPSLPTRFYTCPYATCRPTSHLNSGNSSCETRPVGICS